MGVGKAFKMDLRATQSLIQFDPSRGVGPPHTHLRPAQRTGKRGPWTGIPAHHFLAGWLGHTSPLHHEVLTTSTREVPLGWVRG